MPSGPSDFSSDQLEDAFHGARELTDEARARFLAECCADNPGLRSTVEQLLAAADEEERSPAWNEPAIVAEAKAMARQELGTGLDRYRLLEQLGSGGMGVVYKAVRADDSFSKVVAVKIVQAGAGDEKVLRRFVQERQILASLEHPNIARLLDGGMTLQGAPFLTMEYIDGLPIDQYVAQRTAGQDEILALFRKICSAVSYAHRNLIIHRDLKPGNILVTAEGEPKLLDFGIAKLLDGSAALTATGNGAMTLAYASPEQIRGKAVTTASDIYSLGVVLYEMLADGRPYREPSSALELAQAIAESSPRTLREANPHCDDDLENIVQKALRKEPERRYASVDHFSDDIQRYQQGYPVTARPDTRGYRLRKFIARNRVGMAAAVLALVTLLAGSTMLWRQAQISERRFSEVRRLANSYLFEFHDAIKDLPGATPARKLVVKRAIEFLDVLASERGNDVDLGRELATAYDKIGDVQGALNIGSLGDQKGALVSHRQALGIRQALSAAFPSNVEVARELAYSYTEVGWMLSYTGDLRNSTQDLRQAVALGESLLAAHPADETLQEGLALSYTSLGDVLGNPNYQNLGDARGALEFYRKSARIREKLVAKDPGNAERLNGLAGVQSRLGQMLQGLGDRAGAATAQRQAADIFDGLLQKTPGNASYQRAAAVTNRNLALLLVQMDSLNSARARSERSFELFEKLSREDPQNIQAKIEFADSYYAQGLVRSKAGDFAAARTLYGSAIAIHESVAAQHPADPPRLGLRTTYQLLADLNLKTGDNDRAVICAQRELAIDDRLLRADSRNAGAERNRGLAFRQIAQAHEANGMLAHVAAGHRIKELQAAESWYRRSLALFRLQREHGTLLAGHASELDNTPRAIARCSSALEELGAAP